INPSDSVLAAKYGFTFQWKINGKNIDRANYGSYQSGEPGIYSLQVKQGDCVVNSNKVEVVKQNILSVKLLNTYNYVPLNAKDTLTACNGMRFDLYTYQRYEEMYRWNKELYKDGKLIRTYSAQDQTNYTNYFTINESGQYSIKLYPENQKNCIAYSDTNNVLLVDKPFNLPMDTVFACADSIYLYSPDVSTSDSTNNYQWSFKNKVIGKNYYLQVPLEEGIYTAEVKQTKTCSVVQPILVQKKINAVIWPVGDKPNSGVTFCNDKDNILHLYNVYNSSIEWYRDQQKLPDTLNFIKANQAGDYFVKVKFKDCEATSSIVKVDLPKIKNQISPLVDSLGICINGGFQTLEASKETGYTYEWFKDNISLGESSSSLKATQLGVYKALIQSGDCSVLTPAIKIYPITQLPTATISGDTTLNIGDTANLKLSFTSSPPFTYKLSNNQEGTSEKNTIIHPVKIQESTIFKLASIKNACGEGTVSGEAKVNVIILGNEPLIGNKITIAPVPAESYCEIIIDLPVSQQVSYQLLDMKGQQLSEKNLGNVTYKKQYLNLNSLIAGEYLIRIQVGKDFVTRKLIKY
ncbi:MAG TPA: T9SS type A sorting domain-containing protein, partial [Emticicia sp.]